MGLLNFIKDVGEKLFGASEAKAATPDELKKELDKHVQQPLIHNRLYCSPTLPNGG